MPFHYWHPEKQCSTHIPAALIMFKWSNCWHSCTSTPPTISKACAWRYSTFLLLWFHFNISIVSFSITVAILFTLDINIFCIFNYICGFSNICCIWNSLLKQIIKVWRCAVRCIVIYFYSKTNEMHQFLKFILFCSSTLHVSDSLSVPHQESKTVHIPDAVCTVLDSW